MNTHHPQTKSAVLICKYGFHSLALGYKSIGVLHLHIAPLSAAKALEPLLDSCSRAPLNIKTLIFECSAPGFLQSKQQFQQTMDCISVHGRALLSCNNYISICDGGSN
jgi:hypothetical protein